ncbi:MAG: hypothetical protein JO020_07120 [Chloroflexi bacterium]|nr:hypothetical protein [Chloroflexota bacterium]
MLFDAQAGTGGTVVIVEATKTLAAPHYSKLTTLQLRTLTALFESGGISARIGSVLPPAEAWRARELIAGAPHLPG